MSLWTIKLVQHWIYTRFGVEYCRERVRQLLHEQGFRLCWLRHHHLNAKAEEQAAFIAELAEWLVAWPEDAELLLVDEAAVRRHLTPRAPWCLVDEIPGVPTGDDHTKVHVYGAVAPLTGRTHGHISPEWGSGEVGRVLWHLPTCYLGKRLLVIHPKRTGGMKAERGS
jgi:hypothetical protein